MSTQERLVVVDHPLIQHKLSVLRDKNTPGATFRSCVREIGLLAAFEVTKHLTTHEVEVETPLAKTTCHTIAGQEPVIVPILRSGLSFLDPFLEVIPTASVGVLGMARNEETHVAEEYYAKMPSFIAERQVIIVDPMLATGGSLIDAIKNVRARGVKDIVCLVMVAAPEGIKAVLDADEEVTLFTCAVDECLNEDAYIVPGLGDAGDRIYGTPDTPVEGVF